LRVDRLVGLNEPPEIIVDRPSERRDIERTHHSDRMDPPGRREG
jgi:hypothetical protein